MKKIELIWNIFPFEKNIYPPYFLSWLTLLLNLEKDRCCDLEGNAGEKWQGIRNTNYKKLIFISIFLICISILGSKSSLLLNNMIGP